MRYRRLRPLLTGLLLGLLLLPACTSRQEEPTQASPPAPGAPALGDQPSGAGSPPAPGGRPAGAGSPLAGSPGALPPPGSPVPGSPAPITESPAARDVAMLLMMASPDNPLELSEAEEKELKDLVRRQSDAYERIQFRQDSLYDIFKAQWKTDLPPYAGKEFPETAAVAVLGKAEAALKAKVKGEVGAASPLPSWIPSPGQPPKESPVEDDEPKTPPEARLDVIHLAMEMEMLAPAATPAQAAQAVPEVASLKEYVADLDGIRQEIRKIATSGDRLETITANLATMNPSRLQESEAREACLEWADPGSK